MAGGHFGVVVRRLERLFAAGTVSGLSEGQLVERFAVRGDEAAFEALLARHGPMVLGICRQALRDPADVEDAFQATFLVLVRKAGTLRDRDLVGNWLFGVASRVAMRARTVAARRRAIEGKDRAVESLAGPGAGFEATGEVDRESRALLHEEVARLPEKYRVPVVLCYLEGLTHEEAARRLGWPVGTVKGRLARARERLHARLTRRGVALSTTALAVALTRSARAAVSPALAESTLKAALAVAAGRALAADVITANVSILMKGVLSAMFWNQVKTAAFVGLTAGIVTVGGGGWAYMAAGEQGEPPDATPPAAQASGKAERKARPQPKADSGQPAMPPAPGSTAGGVRPRTERIVDYGAGGAGGMDDSSDIENSTRIQNAQLAPLVAARDKSPATQAILAKLEEPIVMSFANETPLEDVLKYIKAATTGTNDKGIPIYVEPAGLSEAEKTMTSPVTLDLEGIPLKTTLRLLLKQLHLDYCVRDGVLLISSVAGVQQELAEAEAVLEIDPQSGAPSGAQSPSSPSSPARANEPVPKVKANKAGAPAPRAVEPHDELPTAPAAPQPPTDPGTLKSEAIRKALEQPVKLAIAKDTPLSDALDSIKKAARTPDGTAIPIYVDPYVGEWLKLRVEFDLEGVPLRTSLSLILSRAQLNWTVQDGLLIISTAERLQNFRRIASHFTRAFGVLDQQYPAAVSQETIARFDAPVSLSFPEPTPLDQVLKTIREATKGPSGSGIPVFYGPPVSVWAGPEPNDNQSKEIATLLVRIDVKEIPLRTCLALLLSSQEPVKVYKQFAVTKSPDLDGRLLDGLLVIGDPNWVKSLEVPGEFNAGMFPGMGRMGGQGMM